MARRLLVLAIASLTLSAQPPAPAADEIDPEVIQRLVRQLGSNDFRKREQAVLDLREIDSPALPFLRKQINNPDLELRRRARELIAFIETSPPLRTCLGHQKGIGGLAILPGDQQALSGSEDRTVRRWDLGTGKELERYEEHTKQVWCVAVAPDGRSFVSAGQDRVIRQWPLGQDGAKARELATLPDSVRCLLYLADGKHLLAGSLDAKIYVIDVQTGAIVKEWSGQKDAVLCMALAPNGRYVLTGGAFLDASLCLRDAKTGDILKRLVGHSEHVCAVAFVDADHAVSAGYDKFVRLWDLRTAKVVRTFTGHDRAIYGLAVSPDGKRLISGGYDNSIRLWDLTSGDELRRYQAHTDGINALAFTPNGRWAVSASNDRSMLLWPIPRRVKAARPLAIDN